MKKLIALALLLTACLSPNEARVEQRMDAGTAWTRHTLHAADTTFKGADGVDLADIDEDGLMDVITPWEQGTRVTVSLGAGTNVTVATGLGAVEDAKAGDVDQDGCLDIVAASESKHLWVLFQDCTDGRPDPGQPWTSMDLDTSQRWMQVAVVDIDEDGTMDVVAGGKHVSGFPGSLEVFTSAQADKRTASLWTKTNVAGLGWCMSLLPRDMDQDGDLDLLVSDRKGAALQSSKKGSWWYEQTAGAWVSHQIAQIPGDSGFLAPLELSGVVYAVVDGNRTTIWLRPLSGTATQLPYPTGVGDYHASAVGDLNADGYLDLVLTFALTDNSGVVALMGPDFSRQEISGVAGRKFDNVILADMDADGDTDVVTSEGGDTDDTLTDDLGVIWYENPGPL